MKNILCIATVAAVSLGLTSLVGTAVPVKAQEVRPATKINILATSGVVAPTNPAAPKSDVPNNSASNADSAAGAGTPPATLTAETQDKDTQNESLAELVSENQTTATQDSEDNCLATAVYFEAKSEPLVGQLAVAQVLLNRTQSGRFPTSLCGVVKQAHQFSFVHGGAIPRITNSHQWQTAVAISHIARSGMWHLVIGKAMYFHARRVSPHWHAVEVASLGNHIFYR